MLGFTLFSMQDCSEDSLHEKSGKDNIILPEELMRRSIFPSTNRGIDSEAQLDLQSEKRLLHFLQLHNSSMILKFVQLWKFSLPAFQAISCLLLLKLHRKLEIKMNPVVLVCSELLGYVTGCRKKQIAWSF